MTWPDLVTIGLCILMGVLESKRGFVPAFFMLVGAVLVVEIARFSYRTLFPGLNYVTGYSVTVLLGLAIVATATFLLKRYAPTDIGSFDNSLAGLAGVLTGLVMAHALYGAIILSSPLGMNNPVYANSLFAGQIYELRAWHAFVDFMGRIGTTEVASPTGKP